MYKLVANRGDLGVDVEMQGVLDRIAELIDELSIEFDVHLDDLLITERAKNLFAEVQVKLRTALDMAFVRVWRKQSPACPNATILRQVKFPIYEKQNDFIQYLKKIHLDIVVKNPQLYGLLLQPQPFNGATAMKHLRDLANLGKHIELPSHAMIAQKGKCLVRQDGSVIMCTAGSGPADPRSRAEFEATAEDVELVSINLINHLGADPLMSCVGMHLGLRRYLPKLLAYA
jgi:hypothetical protein